MKLAKIAPLMLTRICSPSSRKIETWLNNGSLSQNRWFTLAVLIAGFLIGSGSIGDIIRTWVAGTGSSADQSEVEETRQDLANQDVDAMGEALGAERARLTYNSAVRCIVLSNNLSGENAFNVPFSDDDLITIEANARALAVNRVEEQEGSASARVGSDVATTVTTHRSLYHGFSIGSLSTDPVEQDPRNWDADKRARHDRAVRMMIVELRNVCLPLLGRAPEPVGTDWGEEPEG